MLRRTSAWYSGVIEDNRVRKAGVRIVADADARTPAGRDAEHVRQGLHRPGERETYGTFARLRTGGHGPGAGQDLRA